MKTKHIFYSMALVAVLGSCTAEEFNTVESNKQDLSVRPLLGDIELATESAQTRFGMSENGSTAPVFVDGDKLGAAIIDVPTYTAGSYDGTDPITQYDIVEYYSCNNAFTRQNGVWTVDQPMVEGNYLFYAPYNEKMQARTPLSITLPEEQDASEATSALKDFYNSGNVVRLGYQFLAAKNGEAQKPSVRMYDVFAYPQFTIKNNFEGYLVDEYHTNGIKFNGGTITLNKVEISQVVTANTANVNAVVCGGVIKHAGTSQTAEEALTAEEGIVSKFIQLDKDNDKVYEIIGKWAQSPMVTYTSVLLSSTTTGCDKVASGTGSVTTPDRTAGIITTLDFNQKELAQGEEYVFNAVLPAMQYSNVTNSLRLKLYVTINEKQYVIEDATVSLTPQGAFSNVTGAKGGLLKNSVAGTVTLISGQKYPQEELNYDPKNGGLTAKGSAGDILTFNLTGGLAQVATEIPETSVTPEVDKIKNNTEFINFFKEQLNGSALTEGASIDGAEYAFDENNTVVINAELIDALSIYNNKGTLTINTALPIATDVTIAGISSNKVTFSSANGKSYTITLGTDYIISVGSGITVNMDGTKTVIVNNNENSLTNSGTIKSLYVMSGKELTTNAAVENIDNIINYGTLSANHAIECTSILNKNVMNVSALVSSNITNNGTININNASAGVQVSAGEGSIVVPDEYDAASILVTGTQTMVYDLGSGELSAAAITEAETSGHSFNVVKTSGKVTLTNEVVNAFESIDTIEASGNIIESKENATIDLTGLTIILSGSPTWTGNSSSATTVENAKIEVAANQTLTLKTIAVKGVATLGANAKIVADGTFSTWNGAASGQE